MKTRKEILKELVRNKIDMAEYEEDIQYLTENEDFGICQGWVEALEWVLDEPVKHDEIDGDV